MPIDKHNHGKKKEEDGSDYTPSANEESEEEEEDDDEEEKDSGEVSDVDEEEILTTSKSVVNKPKLSAVKKTEKKSMSKPNFKEKKEVKTPIKKRKSVEIEEPKRTPKKLRKSIQTEDESEKNEEVSEDDEDKKAKKPEKEWNSKNLDFNLHNEAPENIREMKILLSSTVMVKSKMLEANESNKGLTYDMAVMALCRKTRGNKVFEFNLPMTMVPNLREACDLLMEGNKGFFEKRLKPQTSSS